MDELLDCVVVGGGPAGLTAAVYLARYRRRFRLIDAGDSRARLIPLSRNYPGFPDGVSGEDLLARMGDQARRYGAQVLSGSVETLERAEGGFRLVLADGAALWAVAVILATGVVEHEPALPGCETAVKRGLIRICPICDGYETVGKSVGVIGASDHAAAEALFIRTYSADVTLVLTGQGPDLSDDRRRALAEAGIEVLRTPIERVRLENGAVRALDVGGQEHRFDTVYSAFGVTPQYALADQVGARHDENGRLVTGDHQETSVEGLFAAGDVVRGLNQIAVATGEAALAATTIHNRAPKVWA
ncbi:MAG TPA: NAD(P)/FAD-dependent oxidoreductase [Caulobacteraceae bacterium]|jgi:thioredoxin reductase (NADPH)|nr:NAD(P)/FAD-dependent oxidoreductase [Caulobacteraceae bacterium]